MLFQRHQQSAVSNNNNHEKTLDRARLYVFRLYITFYTDSQKMDLIALAFKRLGQWRYDRMRGEKYMYMIVLFRSWTGNLLHRDQNPYGATHIFAFSSQVLIFHWTPAVSLEREPTNVGVFTYHVDFIQVRYQDVRGVAVHIKCDLFTDLIFFFFFFLYWYFLKQLKTSCRDVAQYPRKHFSNGRAPLGDPIRLLRGIIRYLGIWPLPHNRRKN